MTNQAEDPLVGQRIREYQVLDVVGKGGMGAVYRARHVYLDEDRAIKVIHARLAGSTDFVERFIREARILTKLRHPNLVQLFEFGTLDEDTFFMVLEFIQGESVLQRIQRLGRVLVPEAIRIIREAAEGLQSAHHQGIIHRDISPDNLIVTRNTDGSEVTKVIDFGIAKPLFETSTTSFTMANIFVGKPEYCSPEQCGVLEEGELIDARSDIYSLGVTLYHMLAGRLPFQSRTTQGFLLKHANEIPKPVSSAFPPGQFPEILDQLVQKTLAKKREERHSSMEEFIEDLNSVLTAEVSQTAYHMPAPSLGGSRIRTGQLFARRYMIEKKLGQGGMGAVYKAIDRILEVPVALKLVDTGIADDQKAINRFKREVILARKVAHPNACRIYDIGESEGMHYVSMEFLEGQTLAQMLRKEQRLAPDVGIAIIRQVLAALQEAHRVGVVHRDLKPQNIMVDPDLKAHIMDFGISISADAHRVTQTGALIGTPHYMAPEQFEGKNIDHRADIYSIGVIMFEILTGDLPFQADTPAAIIFAHLKSEPRKPREFIPDFPNDLQDIILKALQKERDQRYQTVREFLKDLDPLSGAPGLADARREQIAHRLIAEQHYSRAIKFLSPLVKKEPDNPQWKRLFRVASSEKISRDLRRARQLIQKKNLIQAQVLIERIHRLKPQSTRVISQIRRLELKLNKAKGRTVESYLSEARELMDAKEWAEATARLQSAFHLQSDNPEIQKLQEEVQQHQQRETEERVHSRLSRAEKLAKQGDEEEALRVLEKLLEESPTADSARALQQRIIEERREREEKQKVDNRLPRAFQAASSLEFEASANILSALAKEMTQPSFQNELVRFRDVMRKLNAVFEKNEYESVAEIVTSLHTQDPHGWLDQHKSSLDQILQLARQEMQFREIFVAGKAQYDRHSWKEALEQWQKALEIHPDDPATREWMERAENNRKKDEELKHRIQKQLSECERLLQQQNPTEAKQILDEVRNQIPEHLAAFASARIVQIQKLWSKEDARQNEIRKELAESTQLFEREAFDEALKKINQLLEREPDLPDASRLKSSIEEAQQQKKLEADFHTAYQAGKKLFDDLHWEEAVRHWQEAVQLIPDPNVKEWIDHARSLIARELDIREDINRELARCAELILNENISEASRILQNCQERVSSEKRLGNLQPEVDEIRRTIEQEKERIAERTRAIQTSMKEATLHIERDQFTEALEEVEKALSLDPDAEEARTLQARIRNKVADHKVRQQLSEYLRRILSCFREYRLSDIPSLLHELQGSAKDSSWAEPATYLSGELENLLNEIKSGHLEEAERRFNALLSRSTLVRQESDDLKEAVHRILKQKREGQEGIRQFQTAMQTYNEGKWEQALLLFQNIERIRPGNPDVLRHIAACQDEIRKSRDLERIAAQKEVVIPPPSTVPPRPAEPVIVTPPVSAPSLPKNRVIITSAVALAIILAIIAIFVFRTPAPPPSVSVAINALPWAYVKVTPLTEGIQVPEIPADQMITPCTFMLPSGSYSVELKNDANQQPLIKEITVGEGQNNRFTWKMPAFNAEDAVSKAKAN